jgi:hypothetical protein
MPVRRKMHPALIALLAGGVVFVAAFVPTLWQMWRTPPRGLEGSGAAVGGTPWAIETLPGVGTRVFGLRLPGATLADAQAIWGDELTIALMATRGAPPVLEATVDNARTGPVSGRLLFTAEAPLQVLQRWRDNARKEEPVSADTRRIALRAADLAEALHAPLVGIGFIPSTQLDAAALRARFGEPAEVLRGAREVEHWMYPANGLAVALDAGGRELLQYVAPVDFERRLRAPLLRPAVAASAAPG